MDEVVVSRGYQPDFDIDAERGSQAEAFVADIIAALRSEKTEVKRDDRSQDTGRIFVEYECMRRGRYRPSGLATTKAMVWVFVLEQGQVAVAISVQRLKALAGAAYRRGRIAEERDGSHPTKGVLVELSDLIRCGTKAVRAGLLRKYVQ